MYCINHWIPAFACLPQATRFLFLEKSHFCLNLYNRPLFLWKHDQVFDFGADAERFIERVVVMAGHEA